MAQKVFSCSFSGLNCNIVEVEADISQGMPSFSIVGLGDISVKESRERIRSSIKNSGAKYPMTRKVVNLAPAQLRKVGSLFDFPMAVAILLASEQISSHKIGDAIIVGELSLNGGIKAVAGILAIAQHAKECGFKKIFIPRENDMEASFIDGIEIYPVNNLKEFIDFCQGLKSIMPILSGEFRQTANASIRASAKAPAGEYSLSKIIGLHKAKRALGIAAAGGHNVLLLGPPGTGKTILARAFQGLLPPMSKTEILETSKIFSIAGLLDNKEPLILNRPFREVHHTASLVSVIGGIKPGEITLAHNGVLFFDEITEFPRSILEALRQPLEDRHVTITRSNFTQKFPCNFVFIAAMNFCPCGYYKSNLKPCLCTENQIKNYQKRISGPIRDRFDIFLEIPQITLKNIFENTPDKEESSLIQSIQAAHQMGQKRFSNQSCKHSYKNADMNMDDIQKYCYLGSEAKILLDQAAENLKISNRGYIRTIKLARTIADMEGCEAIQSTHIAEALQYKKS